MKINDSVTPGNKGKYHTAIAIFCEFLNMKGYEGFIRSEANKNLFKSDFIPYIFDNHEIKRMFDIMIKDINDNPSKIEYKTQFLLISLYYLI